VRRNTTHNTNTEQETEHNVFRKKKKKRTEEKRRKQTRDESENWVSSSDYLFIGRMRFPKHYQCNSERHQYHRLCLQRSNMSIHHRLSQTQFEKYIFLLFYPQPWYNPEAGVLAAFRAKARIRFIFTSNFGMVANPIYCFTPHAWYNSERQALESHRLEPIEMNVG
jgi:hypothetical protein